MLDGSDNTLHYCANMRYLGDTYYNFACIDGSHTHFSDTMIERLTPSRMSMAQFDEAANRNSAIQCAYYREERYHGD